MGAFLSFLFTLAIIWVVMWGFFKFMYPKPPREFMPKKGDVLTPRDCDFCGYPLAQYRGVIEEKPDSAITETQQAEIARLNAEKDRLETDILAAEVVEQKGVKGVSRQQKKQAKRQYEAQKEALFEKQQAVKKLTTWFFCNYEHQAQFHNQKAGNSTIVKPDNKS